jgi:hypothetical protein
VFVLSLLVCLFVRSFVCFIIMIDTETTVIVTRTPITGCRRALDRDTV